MPAEAIHLTSLREGAALADLPLVARRALTRAEHAARLGALFPDLPYFAGFARELVRYVVGLPPQASPWGARTHDNPVPILHAFIRRARRGDSGVPREQALAFALGLASHLATDRALHPLVNWLADADVAEAGGDHGAAHREVEKFQSICFHERYLGQDMMGTSTLRGYLFVAGINRLEKSPLGRMAQASMRDAFGGAPDMSELGAWGRSFVHYTHVIGGPLGARVAPPRAKEAARPRYLEGSWGTFEAALERAMRGTGPVLTAVCRLLDGDDAELAPGEVPDALRGLLDEGTINPPGRTFSAS